MDLFTGENYQLTKTGVAFQSDDAHLKEIYDLCEKKCLDNRKKYGDYDVLIEGAGYMGIWLETQPMGGEMYAKRNLETALNTILIFLRYQRRDGKYPGMIRDVGDWRGITAHYDWLQGCFLPYAALRMYYLIGKNQNYLDLLYLSLKDFDDYLWKYRDSNHNGCLEAWCIWDTGEDHYTGHILHGLHMPKHGAWSASTPPKDYGNMPHDSAQIMSYSYACRSVLARISELLGNGHADFWNEKARQVQDKFIEYLWDDRDSASYDRDRDGNFLYILSQSNIKCMYSGIFTQEMADAFIKKHLLNPDEFWTPYPLPSIAANNDYFHVNKEYSNCYERLYECLGEKIRGMDGNSWSGPVEGLTYQRSISAMLNYNHHAETVLIGKRLLDLIKHEGVLKQQYNPFTGESCKDAIDGYGPTTLAVLEYISLLYGINIAYDQILWSGADSHYDYEYTQTMFGHDYKLRCCDKMYTAYIDGDERFSFCEGIRIETDLEGNPLAIYGIAESQTTFQFHVGTLRIESIIDPNEKIIMENGCIVERQQIPFDYHP